MEITQQTIDEANLIAHQEIAAGLRAGSLSLTPAIELQKRWLTKIHPEDLSALHNHLEWNYILAGSLDSLCELITSASENATRIRSNSPLTVLLPHHRRMEILDMVCDGLTLKH